jgi:hypothetical protein
MRYGGAVIGRSVVAAAEVIAAVAMVVVAEFAAVKCIGT